MCCHSCVINWIIPFLCTTETFDNQYAVMRAWWDGWGEVMRWWGWGGENDGNHECYMSIIRSARGRPSIQMQFHKSIHIYISTMLEKGNSMFPMLIYYCKIYLLVNFGNSESIAGLAVYEHRVMVVYVLDLQISLVQEMQVEECGVNSWWVNLLIKMFCLWSMRRS